MDDFPLHPIIFVATTHTLSLPSLHVCLLLTHLSVATLPQHATTSLTKSTFPTQYGAKAISVWQCLQRASSPYLVRNLSTCLHSDRPTTRPFSTTRRKAEGLSPAFAHILPIN